MVCNFGSNQPYLCSTYVLAVRCQWPALYLWCNALLLFSILGKNVAKIAVRISIVVVSKFLTYVNKYFLWVLCFFTIHKKVVVYAAAVINRLFEEIMMAWSYWLLWPERHCPTIPTTPELILCKPKNSKRNFWITFSLPWILSTHWHLTSCTAEIQSISQNVYLPPEWQ